MLSPKSKNKNDKKVAEAAQKFHSLVKSGKPRSPRLINLIAFRAQQASFSLAHKYGLGDAITNTSASEAGLMKEGSITRMLR
jgi:hypothetical protein